MAILLNVCSQYSLYRIPAVHPHLSASPIARNSDSLSWSPPSPERMNESEDSFGCPISNKDIATKSCIRSNSTDGEYNRKDSMDAMPSVTCAPSSSPPLLTITPIDTVYDIPARSDSPTFGRRKQMRNLFRAVSEPRKSITSPIVRSSNGSDRRFVFQPQPDDANERSEVDHLAVEDNAPPKNESSLGELESLELTPNSVSILSDEICDNKDMRVNSRAALDESNVEKESQEPAAPNSTEETSETKNSSTSNVEGYRIVNRRVPRFHSLVSCSPSLFVNDPFEVCIAAIS